jgi:hypothetical protein
MTQDPLDTFITFLCAAGFFGIVIGMILISYEDGIPMARWKKLRCKLNWHERHLKVGKTKVQKYYCSFCKKPRKHPPMKIVDGGNKMGNNKYNF